MPKSLLRAYQEKKIKELRTHARRLTAAADYFREEAKRISRELKASDQATEARKQFYDPSQETLDNIFKT